MATKTAPKTARRHECSLRHSMEPTYRHTSGAGTPKRKSCIYCGGPLTTMEGWWGVFVHSSVSGDARYRGCDAVSLHARESDAQAQISADTTGTLVTRWVCA